MTMNQLESRWQAHQSARSEYEAQFPEVKSLCERIRATLARNSGVSAPVLTAQAA